jgi:hypothetical protein
VNIVIEGGPVTTFSVISGLEYNLTHSGCADMLTGRGFAGVPVYVTLPVMIPPPGPAPAMTGTSKMDRAAK